MRERGCLKTMLILVTILCCGWVTSATGEDERRLEAEDPVSRLFHKKLEDITLGELFEASDCVVMGSVKDKEVRYYSFEELPEERRRPCPMTFVKVQPEAWFKLPEASLQKEEVLVRIWGGRIQVKDGLFLQVFADYTGGTPDFEKDEQVVLFLTAIRKTPYLQMLLGRRGKYVVEKARVYNEYLGREASSVPLETFLNDIRKLAEEVEE